MAQFTAIALQDVATNGNVLLTETPVQPTKGIIHREGSGLVTLKGNTQNCFARYSIMVSANIAVPDGGTTGAISLALALDGEALPETEMIVTPTAAEAFFNVATQTLVDVPRSCCATVSIQNTSTQTIDVENANLIITRVA